MAVKVATAAVMPEGSTQEHWGRNTPGLWGVLFLDSPSPPGVPGTGVPHGQIPNLDEVQMGGNRGEKQLQGYKSFTVAGVQASEKAALFAPQKHMAVASCVGQAWAGQSRRSSRPSLWSLAA